MSSVYRLEPRAKQSQHFTLVCDKKNMFANRHIRQGCVCVCVCKNNVPNLPGAVFTEYWFNVNYIFQQHYFRPVVQCVWKIILSLNPMKAGLRWQGLLQSAGGSRVQPADDVTVRSSNVQQWWLPIRPLCHMVTTTGWGFGFEHLFRFIIFTIF